MQVVVVLDVDAAVDTSSVSEQLPETPAERRRIALTELGYERAESRDQINWDILLDALQRLCDAVLRLRPGDGSPLDVQVVGLAPLSAFFVLGTFLDGRTLRLTALNQRRNDPSWDVVPLTAAPGPRFFAPATNIDPAKPQLASGRVVLFVSTQAPVPPIEAIRPAVERGGERLADIVVITTPTLAVLDQTTMGSCMSELVDALAALAAAWPSRSGLAVVLAGPAHLALAVGFALNSNLYLGGSATIDLIEQVGGAYTLAGRLPLAARPSPAIPRDAASQLARAAIFAELKQGVALLKSNLRREHVRVPEGLMDGAAARDALGDAVLGSLGDLAMGEEPEGDDFWLSVLHRRITFGHGLLHGLLGVDGGALQTLGQLFVLHELVHDPQWITSNTYRGIGRAGVVLEDLDYWADAFAIAVAFEHRLADADPAISRDLLVALIDAHVAAMRAFDRMEQGEVLGTLSERRLRRYLIWAVQRSRAATITSPDDARALLDVRVCAEVAPIKGRLDQRDDKIVLEVRAEAELFVTAAGRLVRMSASPGFSPVELVHAVRTFDARRLNDAMHRVVDQGRSVLATWARPR